MKLGVMCSGNGTNFENIVRTCRYDEVVIMVHNKEKCGAAKRANKFGISHTYIKSKNEDLIIDVMKAWKVDLIVLAGWMRIISPKLIEAFPNKIINLHPSMYLSIKDYMQLKEHQKVVITLLVSVFIMLMKNQMVEK